MLSRQVIVQFIRSTTTRTRLLKPAIDPITYPTGIRVSGEDVAAINLTTDKFCDGWNYLIAPKPS